MGSFGTRDGEGFLLAALVAGVVADGAERPIQCRGCERERREEDEFVPEQRRPVFAEAAVAPGLSQFGGERVAAGELDAQERRRLADFPWGDSL